MCIAPCPFPFLYTHCDVPPALHHLLLSCCICLLLSVPCISLLHTTQFGSAIVYLWELVSMQLQGVMTPRSIGLQSSLLHAPAVYADRYGNLCWLALLRPMLTGTTQAQGYYGFVRPSRHRPWHISGSAGCHGCDVHLQPRCALALLRRCHGRRTNTCNTGPCAADACIITPPSPCHCTPSHNTHPPLLHPSQLNWRSGAGASRFSFRQLRHPSLCCCACTWCAHVRLVTLPAMCAICACSQEYILYPPAC